MSNLYSVAEVIHPARILFSRKPDQRLAVTLLTTVLDIAVLALVAPIAFHCAFILPAVAVAFSLLSGAMFVSLAHMWLLTFRFWSC